MGSHVIKVEVVMYWTEQFHYTYIEVVRKFVCLLMLLMLFQK